MTNSIGGTATVLVVRANAWLLLDRNSQLTEQVRSLQQQLHVLKKKSSISPLEIAEKVQLSPLDNGDSVSIKFSNNLELQKSIFHRLSPDIISHIQSKAQSSCQHFHEFLFTTLTKLASQSPYNYPEILPGLTFTWNTLYYHPTYPIHCPKIKPHCQNIPLERQNCECHLIYSIPQVSLNLATFRDFPVSYQNQIIFLTPMTFLDYGFLKQLIFTNISQTARVNRKLAICIQNKFSEPSTTTCQVMIHSKMPEWTPFGTIIPAQHIMNVTSNKDFNSHFGPSQFQLLGCEFPTWICSHPIHDQIRDFIAYQIASHIDDTNPFTLYQKQFRLFSEDPNQKIRTTNYSGEVPFNFYTQHTEAVQFFETYIKFDEHYHQSNEEFLDDLSDNALTNLDNIMEY